VRRVRPFHKTPPTIPPIKLNSFANYLSPTITPIRYVNPKSLPKDTKYFPIDQFTHQPDYYPSQRDTTSFLKWFSKHTYKVDDPISSTEYDLCRYLLDLEFLPFARFQVLTLEDALKTVDMSKSPGLPYTDMGCVSKQEAWDRYHDVVVNKTEALLRGEYVESVLGSSLKDELLPDGKRARVFLPAPFHHQLACAMLFSSTCESLYETHEKHAMKIGMDIFGQGLFKALRSMSKHPYAYEGDVGSNDLMVRNVEPIRDFMKTGHPKMYHKAINNLFDQAMNGCYRVIDAEYLLQMNPSGWYLTSVVNSFNIYLKIFTWFIYFCNMSPLEAREHLAVICGGDDHCWSTDILLANVLEFSKWALTRGTLIESPVLQPRGALELMFFSHQIVYRKVAHYGERLIPVAAGRVDKILASMAYLKVQRESQLYIDWYRNASRMCALLACLWPHKTQYDLFYPYCFHFIHDCHLRSGLPSTPAWSSLFASIPNDKAMMSLWKGARPECRSCLITPYRTGFESKRAIRFKETMATSRASSVLESLVSNSTLTPAGKDWILCAVDPFHDRDIEAKGFPDLETSATLVQCVKQQLVVSAPGSVTGNWDVNITLFPNLFQQDSTQFQMTGNSVNAGSFTPSNYGVGGLVCHAVPSGQNTWQSAISTPSVTYSGISLPDNFAQGPFRVIGMGFEVVNATAEIYRQGSVTVYRQPAQIGPDFSLCIFNIPGTLSSNVPVQVIRQPPASLANALLLNGSRTWEASKGAYVVSRLNSVDNPLSQVDNAMPIWIASGIIDSALGYSTACTMATPQSTTVGQYFHVALDKIQPFDISGAYFIGLSQQTTLTITVRWYIERNPTPDEPDLVVLATPSPRYDPKALEIYSEAMYSIPPGVPVNQNPAGEFFRTIVSNLKRNAPKIGRLISDVTGFAPAAMAGNLVGAAAGMVETQITRRTKPNGAVTTTTTTVAPKRMLPKPPPLPKKRAPTPRPQRRKQG